MAAGQPLVMNVMVYGFEFALLIHDMPAGGWNTTAILRRGLEAAAREWLDATLPPEPAGTDAAPEVGEEGEAPAVSPDETSR